MQYDFNLPPGGALNLDVKGKFFKYRSGAGPIRVRASKGGYVDLMPGQGVWSLDYDSLNVQDRSGANNAGVLIAGDFDFYDDRITGSVEVIDGGRSRTMADSSFLGYVNSFEVQSEFSHAQLWNPPGNNKKIYVSRISFSSKAAAPNAARVVQYNVALTTLSGSGVSKKMAGAPSSAQLRIGTSPAQLGSYMFTSYLSPNVLAGIDLKEPILLMPGTGVCTVAGTTGVDFPTTFDFYEESI